MILEKGTYVRIRKYLLLSNQRLKTIPEDTSKVPFKMWIKGRLLEETELFEEAKIETATGRIISGVVKEKNPKYKHSYGEFVEELMQIREIIKSEMRGDNDDF